LKLKYSYLIQKINTTWSYSITKRKAASNARNCLSNKIYNIATLKK